MCVWESLLVPGVWHRHATFLEIPCFVYVGYILQLTHKFHASFTGSCFLQICPNFKHVLICLGIMTTWLIRVWTCLVLKKVKNHRPCLGLHPTRVGDRCLISSGAQHGRATRKGMSMLSSRVIDTPTLAIPASFQVKSEQRWQSLLRPKRKAMASSKWDKH